MMTDVRWSTATSATRGAEGRRASRRVGLRRAGKWCAAALAAGAAVALSTGPAPAATPSQAGAPPIFWGEPVIMAEDAMPFIARGSSGEVTFGLKGTEQTPSHVKKLVMRVYTPEHTRLVDSSLTPLNGAPSGWNCSMTLGMEQVETGGDRMECTSGYAGPLPAAGQEWGWKINVQVPTGEPMPPEWVKTTNGWAAIQAQADDDTSAWSSSMSMGLRTTAGAGTAAPAPAPAPAPASETPEPTGSAGLTGLLGGGLLGSVLPS